MWSAGDVDYQIAMCSSMNDSSTNESDSMLGSGMAANITAVLCLNVTILGDDTVEDMEYINISFTPSDDQDQVYFFGPSQAQVHIVDDDGELSELTSNASSPIILYCL